MDEKRTQGWMVSDNLRNPRIHVVRGLTRFEQQEPHKVFLWDSNGMYVECAFPNPVHGHFFGGHNLLGVRLTDILPRKASKTLSNGIAEVLKNQEHLTAVVKLERNGKHYEVGIRLFPLGDFVMGLVNDRLLQEPSSLKNSGGHIRGFLTRGSGLPQLRKREWAVASTFGQECSNPLLADQFRGAEEMVKLHGHITLGQLQHSARGHLGHLRFVEFLDPNP